MLKLGKKVIAIIMAAFVMITAIPILNIGVNANAVTKSEFDSRLSSFKSTQYSNGSTYVNNPSKTGGYQCFGFANEIALWIFGSYPTSGMSCTNVNKGWSRTYGGSGIDNLSVGDIVRYYYHSIFITGISGDTIYYAQANVPSGTNKVTYDNSISRSSLRGKVDSKLTHSGATTKGWVAHFDNNNAGTHTHVYNKNYEAAHPHKVYMKCSCGEYYYTGETTFSVNCTSCNNTSVINTYPTPFKAVTLRMGKTVVSSVNGATEAKANKIYDSDLCTVDKVYANGWCHVTFPLDAGGTDNGYVPLSVFLNKDAVVSTKTINTKTTTYKRSNGAESSGYIGSGDTVTIVGTSGSYTQIIYPLSAGGYKLAWAILPEQPGPSGTAVGCAENWIAKAQSGLKCRVAPGTGSAEVVAGYGIGYDKEIVLAKTQYDTAGNLWGWGYGYNDSLGKKLEGWFCLNYAEFNYSYIPAVTTVSVAPAAYPDKTLVSWKAVEKATKYDVYIDGKCVVSGTKSTQCSLDITGGSHKVKIAAINGNFPYIKTYNCYSITDEISFKTTTKQYTVSYDANGGMGAPSVQYKQYNTNLSLSTSVPAKEGHTFKGWAVGKNESTVVYNPGDTYSKNEELSLVAVWKANTYTIKFDYNNASGTVRRITKTYGVPVDIITEVLPKKDGYTFIGWSEDKDADFAEYVEGEQFCLERDATLFAIWIENAIDYVPGDINGDGIINNKDLTRLLKYLAGETVAVVEEALDINGDGKINNKDLTRLLKYIAGEDVELF